MAHQATKRRLSTMTSDSGRGEDTMSTSGLLGLADTCPLESFVTVLPAPPQHEPRRGILRYIGPTDFADGVWAGVELVGAFGRNDGNVKGRKYFSCLPGQGLFVKPDLLVPYGMATQNQSAASSVTHHTGDLPQQQEHSSSSKPHVAKGESTTSSTVECAQLQTELTALRATLATAASEHDRTYQQQQEKIAALQAEIVGVKADAARAKDELMAAQSTVDDLRKQAVSERVDNSDKISADASVATAEAALDAAVQRHRDECAGYHATITALEEKLAAAQRPSSDVHHSTTSTELQSKLRDALEAASIAQATIETLTKERDDLKEVCDLQEEELLEHEKLQSSDFSAVAKAMEETHAKEKSSWMVKQEQMRQQQASSLARIQQLEQQLTTATASVGQGNRDNGTASAEPSQNSALAQELDVSRRTMAQLTAERDALKDVGDRYANLQEEMQRLKRTHNQHVESLTGNYEEALERARTYKDKAQADCVKLRAQLQEQMEMLSTNRVRDSSTGSSALSECERRQYEGIIAEQQRDMHTVYQSILTIPQMLCHFGGAADRRRDHAEALARSMQEEIDSMKQLFLAGDASRASHVLDFSTPSASKQSARQMFT